MTLTLKTGGIPQHIDLLQRLQGIIM